VTVTQAGVSPELIVTPPNRDVAADTGRTTYNVQANIAWAVSTDSSWCTVTPSGNGDGTIVATFTENPDVTPRVAHISTIGIIGPVVVTITQAGAAPALYVSPPNQNVSAVAGSINYTVTSNTSWSVQSDSSWCTVTPSGSKNGPIVANFTANTTHLSRTAHISVTATGVNPVSVNLIQAKSSEGVNDEQAGQVEIYPNPNKGIFNIIPAEGNRTTLNIEVEDMNGQTLLKKQFKGLNEYQIDLSSAAAGTYYIFIKSDTYLLKKKVIIIR